MNLKRYRCQRKKHQRVILFYLFFHSFHFIRNEVQHHQANHILTMSSYYDLDEILAESKKISGSFKIDVNNVGFLMNATPKSTIQIKDKVELPFWLVKTLAQISISRDDEEILQTLFSVERPEYLSKLATNYYKASPLHADLSVTSHFYKIVEKWCSFIDQPALAETVFEMLVARVGKINDLSFNVTENHTRENSEFLMTLDAFEKELFKLSTEAYSDSKNWLKKTSKN